MRGLLWLVAVVAVLIAALAFLFPQAFSRLDATSIGALSAGLALAAVYSARMSYRPPVRRADEPIQSALFPVGPSSFMQGFGYAVIWAAILIGAAAIYSLGDWARGVGELIRALIN